MILRPTATVANVCSTIKGYLIALGISASTDDETDDDWRGSATCADRRQAATDATAVTVAGRESGESMRPGSPGVHGVRRLGESVGLLFEFEC